MESPPTVTATAMPGTSYSAMSGRIAVLTLLRILAASPAAQLPRGRQPAKKMASAVRLIGLGMMVKLAFPFSNADFCSILTLGGRGCNQNEIDRRSHAQEMDLYHPWMRSGLVAADCAQRP